MSEALKTKKELILQTAREIGAQQFTPAEIDQLRRKLIAEHGEDGKTGNDYIADVLKGAGLKVALSMQEEAEDQYEEEFEDLLGKRRAEMIARNPKVEKPKREEKLEIANWFKIWLETPDVFFDWLDVRKQSPEYQAKFPQSEEE
jgi:hypothetical protein